MSRIVRIVTALVVILTFTVVVSTVQPQPVYADTDTETILIVLGAVMGGLALLALVVTLFVRNNPAWMPLGPAPEKARTDRYGRPPDDGIRFGLGCGVRNGTLPLVCW